MYQMNRRDILTHVTCALISSGSVPQSVLMERANLITDDIVNNKYKSKDSEDITPSNINPN